VELLKEILVRNGHCCSYLYGSLDPIERKIQAANFREGKTNVLVVTDVAARGIDIPLLECVIHYHFPATPKLFVHRSGRVARAGRHGTAYALVAPDELPYMLDLHLYLGRPIASTSASETPDANFFWCVSEGILEPFRECYSDLHSRSTDVQSLFRVCQNAMQMYLRSRQKPSTESVRRAKELLEQNFGAHPDFSSAQSTEDTTRETFLAQVKNFRPSQTIFEYKKIKHPSNELLDLMKLKRKQHDASIQRRKRERTAGKDTVQPPSDGREKPACELNIVINVPKSKSERSEFFIPYRPSNYYQEKDCAHRNAFSLPSAVRFST
jgi:ATP-dependent RNA helicase DDX54/DBP10